MTMTMALTAGVGVESQPPTDQKKIVVKIVVKSIVKIVVKIVFKNIVVKLFVKLLVLLLCKGVWASS